jgi:hypothetical protein
MLGSATTTVRLRRLNWEGMNEWQIGWPRGMLSMEPAGSKPTASALPRSGFVETRPALML